MTKKITMEYIKGLITSYYTNHDADSFFEIVNIYEFMKDSGFNKDNQIMIEMSNIIVLG